MPHIHVLDQITIDKIAAGEVIERPASIVKELVENAIDAGSTSVKIEIKDGGISFIRITDNGCGIPQDEVQRAFLRHSTSKIETVEDLSHIASLGFRGEALSSIAAVTRTELITKTADAEFGTRYVIEGGKEVSLEDTGAPNGTTFLVHQLFYNVPARRKFLKTPMTEAGHVQDLLMHLALSHPEVAFQFLNNGQEKLRTSGNGKLKDVIYNVYGRDVAANLIEIDYEKNGIHITGFLGKPIITRGNRNFENFFVNGRYVKSAMISKSVEDAYRDFVMQHKFPFAVLHFHLSGENVDINVHPTKMELRFSRQQEVYNTVFEAVHRTLLEPELIQKAEVPDPVEQSPFLLRPRKENEKVTAAELIKESRETVKDDVQDEDYFIRKMKERVLSYHYRSSSAEVADRKEIFRAEQQKDKIAEHVKYAVEAADKTVASETAATVQKPEPAAETQTVATSADTTPDCEATDAKPDPETGTQMDLFEENFLKRDIRAEYKLIGQVFDTYWLVEFKDNLYIIDQHAAHERVLYERTLREMKSREFTSQYLSPPIILSLSMQEAQLLNENMDRFSRIGFEIEPFGGEEYAVRAVPDNLFSIAKKELLMEMIDDLTEGLSTSMTPELIDEKVASLSCKAAVKGNNRLSAQEVDKLIGELLTLDNPYHCPHGRPTIIAMTKRDLEKKFKRIV
ncbi:DNA mismatch repair protein MutL [[Ruminococcus] torques]|uniref:DNA mismatch repair protein MutL n=1 Tax=[Ruminococcus] torques TaxID=33039 RepID=A0A564SUW0_9FIRM|nr:DNA mismatch repair endonuclease MutL [[Ruminococcus] torques]VUW98997.1 DNA mismatch repair protein MutL [[Ruminococcus] torques]